MSEWEWKTLGVIATEGYGLVDGPFGSNLPASCYVEAGIPVIRGSNLSLGAERFVSNEFVYVSEETAQRLERSLARPNDIVFTKKGTIGQTGLVPSNLQHDIYLISSNQMKLTVDESIADPIFVYYYVSSKSSQDKIKRDSEFTGVPKTNTKYLREFPIYLPSLPEQKQIAQTLDCLDRKIENLRKQNETLEAIAQTLFKHWFVDCEFPDKNGNPYKSSGGAMVRSELGEVPEEWSIKPFESMFLIPLRNGLTKPRRIRGAGYPMVNMGELFGYRRIGDIEMDKVPMSSSELEKSLLEVGDVPFARQSLVKEGAGQCSIITEILDSTTFEGHLIRCRINKDKGNPFYFFYYFWSFAGRFQISSLVEQVAAAGIRGSDLAKLEIKIPPVELQNTFFQIIEPLEKSIALNLRFISSLSQTRDTLLPKLMSGKLRIKED